jgi:hypothetical protein
MMTSFRLLTARWLPMGLTLLALATTSAGTFKRITIDGTFADWAGVPVAAVDEEGDTTAGYDLRELYVANDDQYLYVMVKIYASSANPNYDQFHHQIFIDGDNDPGTGRSDLGLGAEMVVEDGYAFSQRYNHWFDGEVTGVDWAKAPAGLAGYQYEARISRSVRDTQPADVPAGSGNPARDEAVFASPTVAVAHGVSDSNWTRAESISAVAYELASVPPPFTGTQTLLGLTTTPWQVNDAGVDLGSDWLAADYDDTQAGWKSGTGLFGFNAPTGVYPPVNTVLTSGRSTYYLRTHFTWNNDVNGVGLLVSNFLSAGAVFHLNGSDVRHVRMPAGTVNYSTPATGGPAQPGTAELIDLPTGALAVGDNVLEVEVHPAAGAGNSLAFGLALIASDNFPPRLEDPTQPADRNVTEGQATTFDPGVVGGTGPFTYQWFNGVDSIPDATNATFTLDPVRDTDAGSYSVEITNPKGLKVTSRAAVLTTTAVPVVLTDPNLPADQTVVEGATATFTVAATGSLLTYQWFKGDTEIDGATNDTLTLNGVPLSDSGTQYSVTVANRLGSVPSRKATLTVVNDRTPPGITSATGGGRTIAVRFSEPLEAASAQLATNYTLDGGAVVQGAVLDPVSGTEVILTTTSQSFGQVYRVTATGVRDLYGNTAPTSALLRSAIFIDGNLEDWNGIPVLLPQDQLSPGTTEYRDLSITNDNDYVYVRIRYYEPVGPLSPANWGDYGHYYQVIFNNDSDPATGGGWGCEVMVENGTVFHLGGGWTDGQYTGGDVAIAPGAVAATDFEFRLSLHATLQSDGSPIFPNPAFQVFGITRETANWTELDVTAPPVDYTLATFPPLPQQPTITVSRVGNLVVLTWPGGGTLETRANLSTGSWTTVEGATSGYQVDPTSPAAGASAFYRVKQ